MSTERDITEAFGDDPLLTMLRRREALTPEQRAAEDAEDRARIAQAEARVREENRARAAKEWEVAAPPRVRENDWLHPGLCATLPLVRRALAWRYGRQGLFMVGRSGLGKSRALWWLARRLMVDELLPVRFLVQGEIMNDINRTSLDAWLAKIDALKTCRVLAWDDFMNFAAIGSRKDVLVTELFDLVNHRFDHFLPMLIATNARTDDFTDFFGKTRAEPLMRRLTEGCEVIDFDRPAAAASEPGNTKLTDAPTKGPSPER